MVCVPLKLFINSSSLLILFSGDVLLKPIVQAAGKDISHWFNPKTKDVR